MSVYAWPSTKLPLPTVNFGGGVDPNVIRTKMDTGFTRQRRRGTATIRTFSAAWKFNDTEFAIFQGVIQYKLTGGADWFTISLPFGSGFKTYTVRFTGGYKFSYNTVLHWQVTADLETTNTSPLTESELNTALS